jgi:Xaa-Pro aminopeptidase
MTVCVESYVGEVGGDEGVKLEQQVLITETGTLLLSTYPFEDELLDRQI